MGPTKISLGIWASDISKIDSAMQTFTASLFVGMRWHDTRLAHAGAGVKTYALADIWHPELLVANDDGSVKRTLPEKVEVTSDGTVIYRQLFAGSFTQRLDCVLSHSTNTASARTSSSWGIALRKSNSFRMKRWSPQGFRKEQGSPRP